MNKGLELNNTKGVRDLKHILQPLKEVWINMGRKKVNNHEGVSVKALLDSRAIGMFVDKKFVEKNGFKLEKLERPVRIRNMDGTENSGGLVTYEIEMNMYYQGHVERIKLDVLERTEVILGIPWLVVYNPEINWETGEVKITRYLALCGKNREKKEKQKLEKEKREQEEKKAIR